MYKSEAMGVAGCQGASMSGGPKLWQQELTLCFVLQVKWMRVSIFGGESASLVIVWGEAVITY